MEQKLEKQIKAYGPIYNTEEFNQNFDTSLSESEYNHQIRTYGLTTKEQTENTADYYAQSTKQMYMATIKEIADKNYLSSVFDG